MSWTTERVELLRKLWGEGHTAAEIAKKLGQVTRNAVIGKAHRLKLPSRVSPIKSGQKKAIKAANTNKPQLKAVPAAANKSKKPKAANEKMPPTLPKSDMSIGGLVPLMDLKAGECRWPNGDPQSDHFGFCAEEAMEGLPYCQAHAQMGYQAATRNRILKSAKMMAEVKALAANKKSAS